MGTQIVHASGDTKMKNGICYVAFGEEYDYQCAHSAFLVRKYSDIPILVVTNLRERCGEWNEVEGVSFVVVEAEQKENRYFKIRMDLLSPFEVTLFCDTDTAVQSNEFLGGFERASYHDVMFSVYARITDMDQLPMPDRYGAYVRQDELPQNIYKEGVFFFQKTEATHVLFGRWEYYWRLLNCGRDMPALFPATTRAEVLKLGILPPGWDDRNGHIIVHAFGDHRVEGLPSIKKFKPFD